MKKILIAGMAALTAAAILTGCGNSSESASSSAPQKKEITVGATAGPHAEVVEAAAKEAAKNGRSCEGILRLHHTGSGAGRR